MACFVNTTGAACSVRVVNAKPCYTITIGGETPTEPFPDLPPNVDLEQLGFTTIECIQATGLFNITVVGMYQPAPLLPYLKVIAHVGFIPSTSGGIGEIQTVINYKHIMDLDVEGDPIPNNTDFSRLDTYDTMSSTSTLALTFRDGRVIWINPREFAVKGDSINPEINQAEAIDRPFNAEFGYGPLKAKNWEDIPYVYEGYRYLTSYENPIPCGTLTGDCGDGYNGTYECHYNIIMQNGQDRSHEAFVSAWRDNSDIDLFTDNENVYMLLDDPNDCHVGPRVGGYGNIINYRNWIVSDSGGNCWVSGFGDGPWQPSWDYVTSIKSIAATSSGGGTHSVTNIGYGYAGHFPGPPILTGVPSSGYKLGRCSTYYVYGDKGNEKAYWRNISTGALGDISLSTNSSRDFAVVDGVMLTVDGTAKIKMEILEPDSWETPSN